VKRKENKKEQHSKKTNSRNIIHQPKFIKVQDLDAKVGKPKEV